jgi:hypothetical protein
MQDIAKQEEYLIKAIQTLNDTYEYTSNIQSEKFRLNQQLLSHGQSLIDYLEFHLSTDSNSK